ncbi:transcriptional regulator [Cohnella sp. CIP 111063]|uniref:helix-turn-helix domain-containing protein n=1 Tax=unclassified Cohnella TaxID=2636738 RepID=UPI000B8BC70F|nr:MULTISPECIES: helix-turn-helix transcriptional regulator [unclassified Cohnella]OXS56963.1 transcriptional regulator [Cohnella sp. CIP 111063]PRX69812.1 helix-turn-helix protein [Cohnella sp. SGD-V74]
MSVYDKKKVGQRIRKQREALEISREQLAEQIGRVPRFCADIERGQAGMSIETMLSICTLLKLSPNELLLGQDANTTTYDETELIIAALNQCTEKQRKDALALLKLFITAIH